MTLRSLLLMESQAKWNNEVGVSESRMTGNKYSIQFCLKPEVDSIRIHLHGGSPYSTTEPSDF